MQSSEVHASVSLISSQSLYLNVSFVVVVVVVVPPEDPEHDGACFAIEAMTMFEMSDVAA